jgi:ribonuclease HI
MLWGVVGAGQGMSNNVAEWTGLMVGLEYVKRFAPDASAVSIFGDSKLVIEQVNRRWRCKQRHLVKLRDKCWEMLEELEDRGVTWTAVWIPREQNSDADALTNKAHRGSKKKSVGGMEYLPFGKCVP